MDFHSNILFYLFLFMVALVTTVILVNRYQFKRKHQYHEPIIDDETGSENLAEEPLSAKYSPPTLPEDVIVLRIIAAEGESFAGYDLLQTFLNNSFRYGEMNIFHRHQHDNGRGAILFSMASATEPGTFDLNTITNVACKGLTLFLQMNTLTDPLAAFNIMLETATKLADELNGVVLDAQGKEMNEQQVAAVQQQIKQRMSTERMPDLFAYENR